jgi:hypothetical protein
MAQFWLVDADFSKLNTPQWRDEVDVVSGDPDNRINHHTIYTPEGTLTYKTSGDRKTTWITEYLIDLNLLSTYFVTAYDSIMDTLFNILGAGYIAFHANEYLKAEPPEKLYTRFVKRRL